MYILLNGFQQGTVNSCGIHNTVFTLFLFIVNMRKQSHEKNPCKIFYSDFSALNQNKLLLSKEVQFCSETGCTFSFTSFSQMIFHAALMLRTCAE